MSRHVYISCDFHERELEQVKKLCRFLQVSKCVIQFAPSPGWSFYRVLEEAIERADVFVAVAGAGYNGSTWLNHELQYAHTLQRFRFTPRPRLFGLRIEGHELPRWCERIELEWLDESNQALLLADLPERG